MCDAVDSIGCRPCVGGANTDPVFAVDANACLSNLATGTCLLGVPLDAAGGVAAG